jgi:hypothetical protein
MRQTWKSVVGAMAALLLLGTVAPAAEAGTWNSQRLRAGGFNCLDADRNTWAGNGSRIQTWACNGWSNQEWWANWPSAAGYTTYTTIRTPGAPTGPGKCLDADLNHYGRVQTWDCNGWSNQTWHITLNFYHNAPVYTIKNERFRLYLRASGDPSANGSPVVIDGTPGWWCPSGC